MCYKNYLIFIILLSLSNCTTVDLENKKNKLLFNNIYTNKGFTLIYSEDLFNKKIISKKLDERSLTIFQSNLKKNTQVKITNILNDKTIIATVGNKSNYPTFNNSVISTRIANEEGWMKSHVASVIWVVPGVPRVAATPTAPASGAATPSPVSRLTPSK